VVDAGGVEGIYAIEFATGEVYVGSSMDVGRRWQEHERDLRAGRHRNRALQAAWAATGGGTSLVMIESLPGASVSALARHEAWVVGQFVAEGRSVLNVLAPRRLAQRLVLSPRASRAAPTRRVGTSLARRFRQGRELLILQAAAELAVERGWHGYTVGEVAARVGIPSSTVYLHFARKEDLVTAVRQRGISPARDVQNASADPSAGLSAAQDQKE
jgi:hypothetical protein